MNKVKSFFFLMISNIIFNQDLLSQNSVKKVLFIGDIKTFQELKKYSDSTDKNLYTFYHKNSNINWQTDFESLKLQHKIQEENSNLQKKIPKKFDIVVLGNGLNQFIAIPKEDLIKSVLSFENVLEKNGIIIIENNRIIKEQYPKIYCSVNISNEDKIYCSDTIRTEEKLIYHINDREASILKINYNIDFLPLRQILAINEEKKLINPLEYPQKGLLRSDGYFILAVAYYKMISGVPVENLNFSGNHQKTESVKKVLEIAFERK